MLKQLLEELKQTDEEEFSSSDIAKGRKKFLRNHAIDIIMFIVATCVLTSFLVYLVLNTLFIPTK